MGDYRRPTYTDGYEIRYNRESDMFECWQHELLLSKKDKKPAAYKALALAIKFMSSLGAEVVPEPKKSLLWTPPPPAHIPPLEEQLAALPPDAPRFVVVEAGYGFYNTQGYGVYDREEEEMVCPRLERGGTYNFVMEDRERAEKEAAYCQTHPPRKIEVHQGIEALFRAEQHTTQKPKPKLPDKEVEFASGPHQVGEVITDRSGYKYRVTKASYYISAREAADLEDGWDAHVESGWHTPATLIEEVQS